ncbi:repeats-binding bouquet formation 1 isoform X3 [Octopus vulgaris]|uniref:Repeats-binding bouquet formation 1 isoform X3 n=1 Tax=Octopus vulgaris TaxID=6645 RepID=A0AA36B2T3_OCTVU|nr:repeats-binding bouquet formation 1 isoform X3 [Octopus vulgaris]
MDTNFENTHSTEAKKKVQLMVECIKYHLDDEECLRKSLLAVASLSATNTFVQDYLRENGCLKFILNIFTSNSSSQIKEATMFCLACAIDQNVSSQKFMTTSFVFEHLSKILSYDIHTNNLHHTATYFISCITNNNSYGQMICRKSTCLKNLLALFRSITDKKTKERDILENAIVQNVELLVIVCNAICTCVNNPRNTENQEYCAKYVLNLSLLFIKQCQHLLAVQSVVRLIAVLVASNETNQNTLREMDGIDVLVKTMKIYTLATDNVYNAEYLKTAVLLTSALDTCLLDNMTNAELFGNYGGIEMLVKLLHLCHKDTPNQIQIILAIAHATDHSDINQRYFVDCGGLVLVVNLFIESPENTELQSALNYQMQPTKENTELLSEKLDCILQKLAKLENEGIKTHSTTNSSTSIKEFRLDYGRHKVKQHISSFKKLHSSHPESQNSKTSKSANCITTDHNGTYISAPKSLTNMDDSASQCTNFQEYDYRKRDCFLSVPVSANSSIFSPLNKKLLHTANISKKLGMSSKYRYKGLAPEELTDPSLPNNARFSSEVSYSHAYFDNLPRKLFGRPSAPSRNEHYQQNLIQENSPISKKPLPNSALEQSTCDSPVLFQEPSASGGKNEEIWSTTESPSNFKKKFPSSDNQNIMSNQNSLNVTECCCTSKKFTQCPAGNPPASSRNQLLTSRNYNIILEVDPHTCPFHRQLRQIERDLIKNLTKTNKKDRVTNSYIRQEIPGSSAESCSRSVYDVILTPDKHKSSCDKRPEQKTKKKNDFSICEMRRLRRGVRKYGCNWTQILKSFEFSPKKTPEDLRNKWRVMNR